MNVITIVDCVVYGCEARSRRALIRHVELFDETKMMSLHLGISNKWKVTQKRQ